MKQTRILVLEQWDFQSSAFSNDQGKSNNNDTSLFMNDQQSNNPISSQIDSRFSPNTNSILYSFSIAELADFHKKRINKQLNYMMLGFGIFGLIGLIMLGVSFALPKCESYTEGCSPARIALLATGASFLGCAILLILIVLCVRACQVSAQFDDFNDMETRERPIIWRLDGEEWISYLNYIYGPQRQWTDADPLLSFCCRRSSYQRLTDRQHGHIILYGKGLIIDELYFISFRQYLLQGVQLLTIGEYPQRRGLRVHTYLEAGKNSRNCYFDIFAPSSVSLEELQTIAQTYNQQIQGPSGLGMAMDGLHLAAVVLGAMR